MKSAHGFKLWRRRKLIKEPCPNCGHKGADILGDKAICAVCANVWNWKLTLVKRGRT
jgi:hypothetical protein